MEERLTPIEWKEDYLKGMKYVKRFLKENGLFGKYRRSMRHSVPIKVLMRRYKNGLPWRLFFRSGATTGRFYFNKTGKYVDWNFFSEVNEKWEEYWKRNIKKEDTTLLTQQH